MKPSERFPEAKAEALPVLRERMRLSVTTNSYAPSPQEWEQVLASPRHHDTVVALEHAASFTALVSLLDELHERLEKAGL